MSQIRLPGISNDFDIIERASCQAGFSDEAVGLTMCRQCAIGNWRHEHVPRGFSAHDEGYDGDSSIHDEDQGGCPPIGNILTVGAKRFHYAEVLPADAFAVVWSMGRPVSKSQQLQCKEQLRFVSASRFLPEELDEKVAKLHLHRDRRF